MDKAKVYAEVYFFITQLPYSYKEALPKRLVDGFKNNMSQEYFEKFDRFELFINQNPSNEALDMILALSKYWLDKESLLFIKDSLYN